MNILVLDDHRYVCEIISKNLIDEGFDVDSAYSYDDACMFLMNGNKYDAGVFDISLSEDKKDGDSLIKEFKKGNPSAKVAIVSGINECLLDKTLPYDVYIAKPYIDYQRLVAVIKGVHMDTDTKLIKISDKIDNLDKRFDKIEIMVTSHDDRILINTTNLHKIDTFCQNRQKESKVNMRWGVGLGISICLALIGGNMWNHWATVKSLQDAIRYEAKIQVNKMLDPIKDGKK